MFRQVRKSVRKMTRKPRSASTGSVGVAVEDVAQASAMAAKQTQEAKTAVQHVREVLADEVAHMTLAW